MWALLCSVPYVFGCSCLFTTYSCTVLSMPTGLPGGRTHKHANTHTHTHWFGTRYINLLCMTKSLSSSRCLGSTWVFYFLTLCPFFPFPSVSLASFSLSVHVSLCPSTICVIFRPGVGLVHGYSVSYGRYVSSLAMSCSAVEHSLTEIYIHRHKVILYLF